MMTEQRLQEIEAQHQRGLLHRADIDDLIVEARRLKQEMVKCQDIWSTTIAEGMESITELQQQRDEARLVLRLVDKQARRECPVCFSPGWTHGPDCALAAVLAQDESAD